jgi:formylglycine-generating enzyme required for sulfatase activity
MRVRALLAVVCLTGCSLGGLGQGGYTPAHTDGGGDDDADLGSDGNADDDVPEVDADVPEDDTDVPVADVSDPDVPGGDTACEQPNLCGGCAALDRVVGDSCGTCGSGGLVCAEDGESLRCEGDRGAAAENACGGCGELVRNLGDPCGTCDGGLTVCDGPEAVGCDGDDLELNACDGCETLDEAPGAPCGECGELACDGTGGVVCMGDVVNACDGCGHIPEQVGEACGQCGTYVCNGRDAAVCADRLPNLCMGCEDLAGIPGTPCGQCGGGRWVCAGPIVTCTDNDACDEFNLATVEPGSFVQGTSDLNACAQLQEGQRTTVLTHGFRIGVTEVTQAAWSAVLDLPPQDCPTCPQTGVGYHQALGWLNLASERSDLTRCYDLTECRGDIAAPCHDRCEYVCGAVRSNPECTGFRLPTEAEWEYASRAGTTTDTYHSDLTYTQECDPTDPALESIAHYCSDGRDALLPVAGKDPNAWGLYDTLGNASEWVFDGFLAYGELDAIDPLVVPSNSRAGVVRGGSVRTQPCSTRCASRRSMALNAGSATVGFRVAQNLEGVLPPEHEPTSGDALPRQVGAYVLGAKLGSGGWADVFAAVDETSGRAVAVKIGRFDSPAGRTSTFLARFVREANLTASLEHPAIVEVYDHGTTQDGTPWLAMELLEGHDLEAELVHGALTASRVRALLDPALDALQHAHDRGIVHRDLKPSNLFLTAPGTPNEAVHLLDFGGAFAWREGVDTRLSGTGVMVGTPRYLAPEYIRTREATPRSDVYQLGLVMTELLTGRALVDLDDIYACFRAHCEGVEIPSTVRMGPLGDVVQRSLAKDPAARYPDARALREALQALDLETAPLTAPAPHRRGVFVAAGAACVAAALLTWAVWPGGDPPAPAAIHAAETDAGAARAALPTAAAGQPAAVVDPTNAAPTEGTAPAVVVDASRTATDDGAEDAAPAAAPQKAGQDEGATPEAQPAVAVAAAPKRARSKARAKPQPDTAGSDPAPRTLPLLDPAGKEPDATGPLPLLGKPP